MTERRTFYRKATYLAGVGVLLFPLYWLGMPASQDAGAGPDQAGREQAGGYLAELRKRDKLSQTNLGEINPSSETMRLATLGLRCVAASMLWSQAIEYKKKEDWTKFAESLDQIAKLEPNFITVWEYQAWNLSYNLSVEFDDWRDRFAYVIRGINFLLKGLDYNVDEPRLHWNVGWFIGQKIGRADEQEQYRRAFQTEEYQNKEKLQLGAIPRDNWRVAKDWYKKAIQADETSGKKMKGKPTFLFKSDPGMSQINYSEALTKDGKEDLAKAAWAEAQRDWAEYGREMMPTTYDLVVQMDSAESEKKAGEQYLTELEAMSPKAREELLGEKFHALTDEERKALEVPEAQRKPADNQAFYEASVKTKISPAELAERIGKLAPDKRLEANRLARLASEAMRRVQIVENYRQTVNFNFWKARCEFEQRSDTQAARRQSYQARKAHAAARLNEARELYEESFQNWDSAYAGGAQLMKDSVMIDDVADDVLRYRRVLEELDVPFPNDLIVRELVETYDRNGQMEGVFKGPLPKRTKDGAEETEGEAKPMPPEPAADADQAE